MLFNEVPFLDRFERAAKAGFKAVEFLFPYAYQRRGLPVAGSTCTASTLVLHNLPAGDWDAGERGIACLPDRVDEFRDGVARAIEYATRARRAAAQLPGRQGAGGRRRSAAAQDLRRQPALRCGRVEEGAG